MIYVVSIMVIWTVIGFKQAALMMKETEFYQFFYRNKKVIDLIYNCSILGGGTFLALIRLTEPYYFGNVILMLKAVFSRNAREQLHLTQKQDQTSKSYTYDQELWHNSLLNVITSNRNTNIVKLILKAVTATLSEETTPNELNDIPPESVSEDLLSKLALETRTYEQDKVNMLESPTLSTYSPSSLYGAAQEVFEESKSQGDFRLIGNLTDNDEKEPSLLRDEVLRETSNREALLAAKLSHSWDKPGAKKSKKAAFIVTEYAPKIFEYLRKIDGINAAAIQQ